MFVRVVVLGLLLTVALTSGEILNRGWWSHTVFYQVYPRSFMDADDDGVGDLKGKGERTGERTSRPRPSDVSLWFLFLSYDRVSPSTV